MNGSIRNYLTILVFPYVFVTTGYAPGSLNYCTDPEPDPSVNKLKNEEKP